MTRNFRDLLEAKWAEGKFVCVGLDSELKKIPQCLRDAWSTKGDQIVSFSQSIILVTKDIVLAYKPNFAFYIAHGDEGIQALWRTCNIIHDEAPDVPIILDAKFADIGNTNAGYVQFAFEYLRVDAVTVNPYLGREALQPFLDCKDKGTIVLCRTSNPSAGEFQDLYVTPIPTEELAHLQAVRAVPWSMNIGTPLYNHLAYRVSKFWNENGNCSLVVGATYPGELKSIRSIAGDLPILIPAVGAQGGDVVEAVKAGQDSRGKGMIINSSRGIIFASSGPDFADAARRETLKLHESIIAVKVGMNTEGSDWQSSRPVIKGGPEHSSLNPQYKRQETS